jgi:hypothetical protein
MIDATTIEAVKNVPITAYLQSKGVLPAHKLQKGRNQYAYCSPLSGERTPSFFVNEIANVFYDYSTGQKGDVIRLVQQLEKIAFIDAVKRLQAFTGTFDTEELASYTISSETDVDTTFRITANRTLQHPKLIEYVEQQRGIPFAYAQSWVRQIHYTRKGSRYFGIGFRTDSGSWAIRNEKFKTWIGGSDITTIPVAESRSYYVFEGFFNFLSALTYYGKHLPSSHTIVLNSVTNLKQALPTLEKAQTVFCYLDNDRAGQNALSAIEATGVMVVDRSTIYRGYNDFNDFLKAR